MAIELSTYYLALAEIGEAMALSALLRVVMTKATKILCRAGRLIWRPGNRDKCRLYIHFVVFVAAQEVLGSIIKESMAREPNQARKRACAGD